MTYKIALSVISGFLALLTVAYAGDALTEDQARRYVAAVPELTALGQAMEEEGFEVFAQDFNLKEGQPFEPYSTPLAILKNEHPVQYKKVDVIAKKHNFKNAGQMAGTADRVMLAYMALKIPPEAAAMSVAMSPDMLKMLPPETAAQYKTGLLMLKAVENVPQADKDVVAPLAPLIDQVMLEVGDRSGAFKSLN